MSRPTQAPSRPLVTGTKPTASPAIAGSTGNPRGPTSANIPRRSAGAVPGIARTASSLRQSPLIPHQAGPLASIPAHLRNLSAPRIPSPLGRGTPARQPKQSLPVRTSKTTERHVLLPEDPQLAPLPSSPLGSQVGLIPPPRAQPSAGPSRHAHQDERSDAEKMTRQEREEAKLPRLTAYATADGYRLKLLQAFLKREHGVGVVRVFDDCIYAVYQLPLLPGYGASTKVRSSPAIRSPGGVSLLERMTIAEDLGYDDEYFPPTEEAFQGHDPSEYILSLSPPPPLSPVNLIAAADIPLRDEGSREQLIEHVQDRLETQDGIPAETGLGLKDVLTESASEVESAELGTHMSPEHPGQLEHIPAVATSPNDLPASAPLSNGHSTVPYQLPKARPSTLHRRRQSTNVGTKVAEAVFFSYGVSVFFGFQEGEEREIMQDCEEAGAWVKGQEEDDWEVEEFHFVYNWDADYPRIYNDMFTFKSRSHLFKMSLAHAIAQSTKLSIFEANMQESLSLTSSFPKELSITGHLELGRRDALKITGRLFKLRMDVNLIGGILDTPELFWSEASLYPLYEAIREYLEIGPRVQVLNDRLSVAGDLLEIIHEYIEERATHRITWIIIWLIVVACLVEVGEVIARLVFHAIPRNKGEFLLAKGGKVLLGGVREISGV